MQWNVTDLQLFAAVSECGNLTRAAQQCHLSTAAASTRIRALEAQAGCQLLERLTRGVSLTPAGLLFAQHARHVLRENHLLKTQLQEFSGGMQGHVRVLANTTACTEIMPGVLARFLRTHQQVSVRLQEGGNVEIARSVRNGAADLGVLAGELDFSGLVARRFSSDRIVLVAHSQHPLADMPALSLADVGHLPMVGMLTGASLRDFLDERVANLGMPPLRYRAEAGNYEAMCLMAEAGIGVGILGESVARRYMTQMRIVTIPLHDDWAIRHRYVVNRSQGHMPGYLQALIDSILAWQDARPDAISPG